MSLNDGSKIGPTLIGLGVFVIVVLVYFAWIGAKLTARTYPAGVFAWPF